MPLTSKTVVAHNIWDKADDHGVMAARALAELHPSWREFIRFCRELGHGEIERLSIQDGLPMLAETARKKVKFTPDHRP